MAEAQDRNVLLELTAQIVAAHVSKNEVSLSEVPSLIEQVHHTLTGLGQAAPTSAPAAAEERPQPAVPIKKSVTDDYLICLEDGQKMKMLKRHLMTSYDMTPDQYRARWGLPLNYPMVAPKYSKHRAALAKKIGLGTSAHGRTRKKHV